MAQIIDWAKDLLVSRGALVETENDFGTSTLRAMLAPELARSLGSSDWLSLRFGAGAGCDDEGDWLERLGRLLAPVARVTGARLRHAKVVPPLDAGEVLDRELAIQNGIFRQPESHQEMATYYFFNFPYSVESDETSLGIWTVCLNASARSVVSSPEKLLDALHEDLEEDPSFAIPRQELMRLFPVALRAAEPEIRRQAGPMEQSATRRLARDTERINLYYADLLRQIEKRISRRSADPESAAKERSRLAATEMDRAIKLEDMAKKYSVKIRIEPGDVLVAPLAVREISARLIRKKAERAAKFHWNPALGKLESPWCEGCSARALPLFLCDDRVHYLCKSCLVTCASCGRHFCRVCQPRCKCGAAG